jgi:hypothetical protein
MKNLKKTLNSLLSFNPELCNHFLNNNCHFLERVQLFFIRVYLMTPHTKVSNNTMISKYWLGCEMMWLSPSMRHYPSIYLRNWRKPWKTSQCSQPPGRVMNIMTSWIWSKSAHMSITIFNVESSAALDLLQWLTSINNAQKILIMQFWKTVFIHYAMKYSAGNNN